MVVPIMSEGNLYALDAESRSAAAALCPAPQSCAAATNESRQTAARAGSAARDLIVAADRLPPAAPAALPACAP